MNSVYAQVMNVNCPIWTHHSYSILISHTVNRKSICEMILFRHDSGTVFSFAFYRSQKRKQCKERKKNRAIILIGHCNLLRPLWSWSAHMTYCPGLVILNDSEWSQVVHRNKKLKHSMCRPVNWLAKWLYLGRSFNCNLINK